MKNIRIESNDVWNDIVWQMIHVVLYYETVCSLESLRLHKSFFALRLVFISNSPSPSYSYSSRADTFLKASGTLYRFGSKLGVRGRVSLFNFSILLQFIHIIISILECEFMSDKRLFIFGFIEHYWICIREYTVYILIEAID